MITKHWAMMTLPPGLYAYKGDDGVTRQFAIPKSAAAQHVARGHGRTAEIYPDAHLGDMTPIPAVAIDDEQDLLALEQDAVGIQAQIVNAEAMDDAAEVAVLALAG